MKNLTDKDVLIATCAAKMNDPNSSEKEKKEAKGLFMRLTKRKCDKGHRYVNDVCKFCGREL